MKIQGITKSRRLDYIRRVQRENVRRILIASVCFGLFFLAVSVAALLQTEQTVKPYVIGVFAVLSQVYAGAYLWVSYRWLTTREKWNINIEVYLFWTIYAVLLLAASAFTDSAFLTLGVYWLITVVLALVPLWRNKEFLVSQGIQIAAIVLLIWYRKPGIELAAYLFANQFMCCVISRQGYHNFLQRAVDETAIDTAKTLSETDPMTSLLNRRGLEHKLQRIWPGCVRNNKKVAVIMMDIDNFKKYNDCYGHPEGDACIRKVTTELHRLTHGRGRLAARIGGEEFVAFLADVEKEEALQWGIELKEKVEGLSIPHAEDNFLPVVSVSVGIKWGYAGSFKSFAKMQKAADEALYMAKENGRACVYMEGQCHAKTRAQGSRQWYYREKGFRSLG